MCIGLTPCNELLQCFLGQRQVLDREQPPASSETTPQPEKPIWMSRQAPRSGLVGELALEKCPFPRDDRHYSGLFG